mmetsp:Transcript_93682/g.262070  ORF Transcript_93682/g.262070 Transcript_93682/m.262070 type:complete len:256 (+) Transcript_93682:1118-1885(+)
MGLHAPPAFAAMTRRPPMVWRNSLCLSPGTECLSNFRQTIVAVRLSITELRKKHRMESTGISASFRPLVKPKMPAVTTAKPSKWSMDSTTPIAGRRKRMIAPTSCSPCLSSCSSLSWPCFDSCGWYPTAKNVHIDADTMSMLADLFNPKWSSNTTSTRPMANNADIKLGLKLSSSMKHCGQPHRATRKTEKMKVTPQTFSVRRQMKASRGHCAQVWGCPSKPTMLSMSSIELSFSDAPPDSKSNAANGLRMSCLS